MGQFEYTVALTKPMSKQDAKAIAKEYLINKELQMAELNEEQIKVVRRLIAEGALIERQRILEDLEKLSDGYRLEIGMSKLKKVINEDLD